MCDMCETTDQIAYDVLPSHIEREVMFAEEQAGLTPEGAKRPLSKDERRAKVRFREIADLEEAFLAAVVPILERLTDLAKEQIIAALPVRARTGDISPRELVDALGELTATQPEKVREAVEAAVPEIEAALAETYAASAAIVVGEADRQGVPGRVTAPDPGRDRFYAQAKNAAMEPFRRVLTGVQDRVAAPQNLGGFITDEQIVGMVGEITPDKAIDQARQANHGAINAARMDTAARIPLEYAYASEIMDERTCDACEAVDGREYETVEEARRDYPDGGGFRSCAGGARCRGTAVFVFRS